MTTSCLPLFLYIVRNVLTQKILFSKIISALHNEIEKLKYSPGTSRKKSMSHIPKNMYNLKLQRNLDKKNNLFKETL